MAGLMAVVLGWLFMVQGLPDVDVLWSANVATNGPEFLARAAVTVLVTFGVGLVVGGIAAVRRFREPDAPVGVRDALLPCPSAERIRLVTAGSRNHTAVSNACDSWGL